MIYLTGASGFLGNAFYNKISSHYECVCLVRNPNKSFKHNVLCDLNDKNPQFPEIKSDAIVVHCASLIKGTKKSLYHTNVKGTKKLISWAKKNQIKKIIYISSLDVELDNTEYAYSKKQAEQLIIDSRLVPLPDIKTTIFFI